MYERIKAIANEVYARLETKACLEVLFPIRKFILDNVKYKYSNGIRKSGSMVGCYACSLGYDVIIDNSLEETFKYFLKHGWEIETECDYTTMNNNISLILKLPKPDRSEEANSLTIGFNNYKQESPLYYVITLVAYNYDGDRLLIAECEQDKLYINVNNHHDDEVAVLNGDTAEIERLIGEVNKRLSMFMRPYKKT